MKIVFLTFYYPPDLSAGSFRAEALVNALLAKAGSDARITVITTSPNRYAGMEIAETCSRGDPRLTVTRVPVPPHRSGIADQVRSFVAFARGAMRQFLGGDRPDVVLATSSRLFTATLGAVAALRWRAPLFLDIRDIFSETIEHVFARSPVRTAAPFVRALESWTLGKAQQINFVSPAFTDYFAPILRDKRVSVHSNGVDDLFADFVNRFPVSGDKPLRPRVVAAGNIGEGQGLHHIVPGLAAAFPGVEFRIIGGGGRRAVLEQAVAESKLGNVVLLDPVARERLLREYAEASVLFMHLNDLAGFDRVIPSKMFEYAATGRPILAGVRGRSQAMLARVAGAETFAPGDVDAAIAALARLLAGPQIHDREEFVARYDRRKIMARMASEILALKSGGDAITAAAPDKGLPDDP